MSYRVVLEGVVLTVCRHSLEQNHDEVTKILARLGDENQQTRRELETTSRTLMACVTDIGRQVLNKIAFLTQATLEIKQSASQIASSVLSLSLELSSFRLLLMSFQRTPVDKYYFTIQDAVGREFPIHLNTITSWNAFAFVLSEKFRGVRGARRVRDRRYRLIEQATRREVDQSTNWARAFLPHQKIVMSLLCKDTDTTTESTNSQLATCPWCKTESDSDTSTQVQCRNCNMFFTRVVELDDMVLPPQPLGSRKAPQFGRPSFDVQVPPGWGKGAKRRKSDDASKPRKRTKNDSSRSGKRDRGDDGEGEDIESDDEDVSGLVRVTVISKRKRIKLFQAPKVIGHSKPSGAMPGMSATNPGFYTTTTLSQGVVSLDPSGAKVSSSQSSMKTLNGYDFSQLVKHSAPMPYEILMKGSELAMFRTPVEGPEKLLETPPSSPQAFYPPPPAPSWAPLWSGHGQYWPIFPDKFQTGPQRLNRVAPPMRNFAEIDVKIMDGFDSYVDQLSHASDSNQSSDFSMEVNASDGDDGSDGEYDENTDFTLDRLLYTTLEGRCKPGLITCEWDINNTDDF